MKLSDYLVREGLSQAAFAYTIGVSQQAVERYANGERIPRSEIMLKIKAATAGAVTADDFYQEAAA